MSETGQSGGRSSLALADLALCVRALSFSTEKGQKKKRKIERTDFVFCCPFSFHTSEAALHDNYKVYVKAQGSRQRNEKLTVGGNIRFLSFSIYEFLAVDKIPNNGAVFHANVHRPDDVCRGGTRWAS